MNEVFCLLIEKKGDNETVEDVLARLKGDEFCVNYITAIQDAQKDIPWETKLRTILNKFNINSCLKGYSILFKIMEIIANKPSYRDHISLGLIYSEAGKALKMPYSRMERNVRHVIENIWLNNERQYIQSVFKDYKITEEKMTNSVFIAALAEMVFA